MLKARFQVFAVSVVLLCVCVSAQSNDSAASPMVMPADTGMQPPAVLAPAPAPAKAAAAATTKAAPPPPPVYAPKRSFGQWVRDLKHDPTLLIAFIVCLLSGVGSLFIVYALGAELVQSIPYVFQSSKYSSVQQPHQPSPASSMDEKMKESY